VLFDESWFSLSECPPGTAAGGRRCSARWGEGPRRIRRRWPTCCLTRCTSCGCTTSTTAWSCGWRRWPTRRTIRTAMAAPAPCPVRRGCWGDRHRRRRPGGSGGTRVTGAPAALPSRLCGHVPGRSVHRTGHAAGAFPTQAEADAEGGSAARCGGRLGRRRRYGVVGREHVHRRL